MSELFAVIGVVVEVFKELLLFRIGATTVLVGKGEAFPSFIVVVLVAGSDDDFLLWLEALLGEELMLLWPSLVGWSEGTCW